MSKHQTRRTVSLSGATYARLEAFCEAHGVAKARLVEELIEGHIGAASAAATSGPPDLAPPPPSVIDAFRAMLDATDDIAATMASVKTLAARPTSTAAAAPCSCCGAPSSSRLRARCRLCYACVPEQGSRSALCPGKPVARAVAAPASPAPPPTEAAAAAPPADRPTSAPPPSSTRPASRVRLPPPVNARSVIAERPRDTTEFPTWGGR